VLRVGLTGNVASGKSAVAKMLSRYPDVSVLDADEVVHRLLKTEKVKKQLAEIFGSKIFTPRGEVDRKKLARLVFSDRNLLKKLENILHPLVYEEFEKFCRQRGGICVLEAALIFEKGNRGRFDRVVVVYAPFEVAKERAKKRGMSEEDFLRRWKNQMDPQEKKKLADFVVDNSKTLRETEKQVKKLVERLREELRRKEGP
jgi:dephospho-CoA kinase